MIFLPNLQDYSCFSIIDKDTIRGYKSVPTLNQDVGFSDFYINSHYISKDGSEFITEIPTCVNSNLLTDEVYYRNDFPDILLVFLLLSFVCFYLPTKLFMKLFRKGTTIC